MNGTTALQLSDAGTAYNPRDLPSEKGADTKWLDFASKVGAGIGASSLALLGLCGVGNSYSYGASSKPSQADSLECIGRVLDAKLELPSVLFEIPQYIQVTTTYYYGPKVFGTLAGLTGDLTEDQDVRVELRDQIRRFGLPAITAIEAWFAANTSRYANVAEVIRLLGELNDSATKTKRLELLIAGLKHKSPLVRDAAALGLEDLNDKRAIDSLRSAAESEEYTSLKQDYLSIVQSLEA